MAEETSFRKLMTRLRDGDEEAAEQVFRRFARRLIGLARSRLDSQVRQKIDPQDVMQSVFKSFFVRCAEHRLRLDDWDSLWSLLTVMTLRKCGFQTRYFHANRRDVRREQPRWSDEEGSDSCWEAIARDPTPLEAAKLVEAVEQMFCGLDDKGRLIVELALQGYSASEISAREQFAERTVYRVLERVKGRLQRASSDDRTVP